MDNQQGNPLNIMDEYFEPLAYAIGAMTGDGTLGEYGPSINVHIRCMDIDCIQRVKYEIDSFFGTNYRFYSYTNSNGTLMYGYNASNPLVYDLFKYFIGEDLARLLQKLGVKVGKVHEQVSGFSRTIYIIKPNIRSFVGAGCYFQIPRKAKRLRHYIEAVEPSETIMPHPQRRGEDIVQR